MIRVPHTFTNMEDRVGHLTWLYTILFFEKFTLIFAVSSQSTIASSKSFIPRVKACQADTFYHNDINGP